MPASPIATTAAPAGAEWCFGVARAHAAEVMTKAETACQPKRAEHRTEPLISVVRHAGSSRRNHSIVTRRLGPEQISDEVIPRPLDRIRRPLMPRIGHDQHVEVLPRFLERVHQAQRFRRRIVAVHVPVISNNFPLRFAAYL